MLWNDIRKAYPDQWVLIEGLESHLTKDNKRHFDRIAVIETCPDGASAMQQYFKIHKKYPTREFYFIHTSHKELNILERKWIGIRR